MPRKKERRVENAKFAFVRPSAHHHRHHHGKVLFFVFSPSKNYVVCKVEEENFSKQKKWKREREKGKVSSDPFATHRTRTYILGRPRGLRFGSFGVLNVIDIISEEEEIEKKFFLFCVLRALLKCNYRFCGHENDEPTELQIWAP